MTAYSAGIWQRVEAWVRAHRVLIRVKGVEYAAKIARYGASNFPDWAFDREWSPLRGARPTAEQIGDTLRLIGWGK